MCGCVNDRSLLQRYLVHITWLWLFPAPPVEVLEWMLFRLGPSMESEGILCLFVMEMSVGFFKPFHLW